jgi:hypothetical protein
MVRTPPMVIFLCRGEVPIFVVLISRRSSISTNLPSVNSSLELPVTFLTLLSSC